MWQRKVPLSFLSACRLDRLFSVMENSCVPIRVIIRTSAVPTCGLTPLGFSKNNFLDDDYFSVPVDFRRSASYGFTFVDFPNTDQSNSEHVFPQYVSVINETERASPGARGQCCAITNCFVLIDAVPAQYNLIFSLAECQLQFQHQQRVSDSPDPSISTFNIKKMSPGTDKSRGGTWRFANLLFSCFSHQASERRPAQH